MALKLPKSIRTNLLTILTVTGVIAGICLGFALRASKDKWTPREVSYVKFIGELFLNMLKCLIVPLIVTSLIGAVGSLDLSLSGKIGGRGIAFYMGTTVIAIVLGIILAVSIQPGYNSSDAENGKGRRKTEPSTVQDTLLDLLRTMFPPNIVQATLQRYRTKLVPPANATGIPPEEFTITGIFESGTNIMGLIVFSTAMGLALAKLGDRGRTVLTMVQGLAEATMLVTGWVIWLSPLGAMFLIAGQILTVEDFGKILQSLGLYFATVIVGLTIHGFIILPLLFFAVTRRLPFRFMGNMLPAIMTAFGTGSSTATLPVTLQCLEERNKVDPRVSRFLLPIGATINMDGTALYEAVGAIFIAQIVGVELSIGKIIAISVTATAASIGAAGIPQAGLFTMVMVLNTVGLPGEHISYIVPIDWLVDRFRTAINVLGDSFVAGAINQTSRKELAKLPPFEDLNGNSSSKNSALHRRNNEDMEKLPLKSLNADDLHEIL